MWAWFFLWILMGCFSFVVKIDGLQRRFSPVSRNGLCGEKEKGHFGTLEGLFYYFYESTNPSTKDGPIIIWLSGGPGCSSLVALLFENGPCQMSENSKIPSPNTFSWTQAANMLYIDQPAGSGFSPETSKLRSGHSWSETSAIDALVEFIRKFSQEYPSYANQDLYIFGESYAGHYVPDLASAMLKNTELASRLKGIGIGNGLVSPKAIYSTVLDMVLNNSYQTRYKPLTKEVIQKLESSTESCVSEIESCQKSPTCTTVQSCASILGTITQAVQAEGLNPYDIRKRCHEDPSGLCYRFQYLNQVANSRRIQKNVFGFEKKESWSICSSTVYQHHLTKDWFRESERGIPALLDHGIKVLVYAGDADIICNWKGQEKWTREMKGWKYHSEFAQQKLQSWETFGQARCYGGLSFLQLYNCGHMAPHDQPEATLRMVHQFINKGFVCDDHSDEFVEE